MNNLILIFSVLFFFVSCSSSPVDNGNFEYKKHCSAQSYSRIEKLSALTKKQRRGDTNKLEDEMLKRTKVFGVESEESVKPLLFECLAEAERTGNKNVYSICMVADIDLKGKLSYLDIEDRSNPLEAKLKKCMLDQFRDFNFSRYPGVTGIQAIQMDLDP